MMISCSLLLFLACCNMTVGLRVKPSSVSSRRVMQILRMADLNEPLSTYSLSSHPFTMGGRAVTIPSQRSTEELQRTPRLRIFRDPDSQVNSLCLPASAYEIPILPDEEPMVLHTKRLQFANSMVSRMVVGDLQSKANNKLIKARVDRETGKIATVGVLCELVESRRFQSGEIAYVLQGLRRVNLLAFKQRRPYLTAMVSDRDTAPLQVAVPMLPGPQSADREEAGSGQERIPFSDIIACEELCEDIYRDLSTVLRLYKLLSRREPAPPPGFQLFADDSSTDSKNDSSNAPQDTSSERETRLASSESEAPSRPAIKTRSVVSELLKTRTGTPGVELPIEIFRNRPVAALEYTHDELAEMYQHGEELLAQLSMLPQPTDAGQSSVPTRAPPVSEPVPRAYNTKDSPALAFHAAKPSSLRLARLRMLASAALKHTANLLRLPERGLNLLFKAALRRLNRSRSPTLAAAQLSPQIADLKPAVGSALGLSVKTDSHLAAMVQRMTAEVRATQDGMRHKITTMAAEVESLSAMLQFVEDRASAEQQTETQAEVRAEQEGTSDDAASPVHAGGHSGGSLDEYFDGAEPAMNIDVTPLLRRHEAFSHAMCLPTASRDPRLLQQCIEMDTLTRLRTVASALSSDKEHLIQHALAEALLQRRDVHELEDVDLGNDLDVRCYHDVNITQAVFVGLEDLQTEDTFTSVAASRAQELLQDDRAVALSRQVPVSTSSEDPLTELLRHDPFNSIGAGMMGGELVNSVNGEQHVNTDAKAVQDAHSSFFEVDGKFLQ